MVAVTAVTVLPKGLREASLDWLEREAETIDWSSVPTDVACNIDRYLYKKRAR